MYTTNTKTQVCSMESAKQSGSLDLTKKGPMGRFGIKSTNVVVENCSEPVEAVILIEDGKIADIFSGKELNAHKLDELKADWNIKDYGDLFIFPGLVDSNVHLHANFGSEWENIIYCTELAAAGGVTTIVDNPVMSRPFNNGDEYVRSLQQRISAIKKHSKVDFGVFGILEPKTENSIGKLQEIGVLGLKCYLSSCFQSSIGHFPPEDFKHVLEDLELKHPNLLIAIHPEIATEREIYLTSPCRTVPLDKRLDRDYGIKSLEFGGAANKGSYYEETSNKDTNSNADNGCYDDEDELPSSFIDTPSKLEGRINKSKQKTEVKNLVHFELASYAYENKKILNADESGSDSEDILSALKHKHKSQSPVRPRLYSGDQPKSNMNGNKIELFNNYNGKGKKPEGQTSLEELTEKASFRQITKKTLISINPVGQNKLASPEKDVSDKKRLFKENSIEGGLKRNILKEIPEELAKEDKQACDDIPFVEEKAKPQEFLEKRKQQQEESDKVSNLQISRNQTVFVKGNLDVHLNQGNYLDQEQEQTVVKGRKRFSALEEFDTSDALKKRDGSQESQEDQKTSLSTNNSTNMSFQKFSLQSDAKDQLHFLNQGEEIPGSKTRFSFEDDAHQTQLFEIKHQPGKVQTRKVLSLHIAQNSMDVLDSRSKTEIPRINLGLKAVSEDFQPTISSFMENDMDTQTNLANTDLSSLSPNLLSPSPNISWIKLCSKEEFLLNHPLVILGTLQAVHYQAQEATFLVLII